MAQQTEGTRRGAQDASEAGRRATQEALEGAKRAAHDVTQGARRGAQQAAETTQRVTQEAAERGADAMTKASEIYNATAQLTAEDLQAIATFSSIAAGGLADMRHAWMEWLGRSLRTGTRATHQLLRIKSFEELADLQRSFLKESFDDLLEGSAELLRISSRISEEARRPIEERVAQLRSSESQQEEQRA